jgi:hypothetical protein
MAAKAKPKGEVHYLKSPEKELDEAAGQEFLDDADDDVVACRGQGHSFPRLRPGKIATKHVRVVPIHEGGYQITLTCPICKTERTMTTTPTGVLGEVGSSYSYRYDKNYKAPKNSGLTRRDFLDETIRRVHEDLALAASKYQLPDDDSHDYPEDEVAFGVPGIPGVKFSPGSAS